MQLNSQGYEIAQPVSSGDSQGRAVSVSFCKLEYPSAHLKSVEALAAPGFCVKAQIRTELMTLALTKRHVSAAEQKSSWDFGNKILYDMCANYPAHKNLDQIVAKIWLIGRSYAAAIERRKKAKEYNDAFYTEVVGPTIRESGIDDWLNSLERYRFPTFDNIGDILTVHGNLLNLLKDMTGMEKRSLTSKYLHFHKPNLFFIYDSRAIGSLRKLIPPIKINLSVASEVDREYAKFCHRCIRLRDVIKEKFEKHLTPRELDNILLNISE